MSRFALVRYGTIPEVSRFVIPEGLEITREEDVVVRTHRGLELGCVLEVLSRMNQPANANDIDTEVVRAATKEDLATTESMREECDAEFSIWQQRLVDWKLDVDLLDLERTLDGEKLILYTLNGRGPETTTLALKAVTAGLGIIEVQPVNSEGVVPLPAPGSSGGCGSCGGGGGCGHE